MNVAVRLEVTESQKKRKRKEVTMFRTHAQDPHRPQTLSRLPQMTHDYCGHIFDMKPPQPQTHTG